MTGLTQSVSQAQQVIQVRKYRVTPVNYKFSHIVKANTKGQALKKFIDEQRKSFKWRKRAWDRFMFDMRMAKVVEVDEKKQRKVRKIKKIKKAKRRKRLRNV